MMEENVMPVADVIEKAKAKKPKAKRRPDYDRIAALLDQASHPVRLQILLEIAEGELNVGELCHRLDFGQPATSHHLALLRLGGLIAPRRAGKNNYYRLSEIGKKLAGFLAQVEF